jgi:hypothetical protein
MTEITSTWTFYHPKFPAAGAMIPVYSSQLMATVSVRQLYRFDLFSPENDTTYVGQFDTREEAESVMREAETPGLWVIHMVDYTGGLEGVGYGVYHVGEAAP